MSEYSGDTDRANRRILARLTKGSWNAIIDGTPPLSQDMFLEATRSHWTNPRDAYTGLYYTLAHKAYREMHQGEGETLDDLRKQFHAASISVLKSLVLQYDLSSWETKRDEYLGLINEFTPIALLNSAYVPGDSVTTLASREDDQRNKCDIYYVTETGEYSPVQIKTDTAAALHQVPEQGLILFGADFGNMYKRIDTTRALIKDSRTPSDDALLADVASHLLATIERRRHYTQAEIQNELDAITQPQSHITNPLPTHLGASVPKLMAYYNELTQTAS